MRADALGVLGELGSSVAGQGFLLAGTAAVFVAAPDIDHMALRILHHRSILTHSVLLPLLVLWFAPELGPAAASGAALGVAVHLAADLLSPSRGFGRIWLPEPFQVSLGGWSPLWLMINALACAWLALDVLPSGETWRLMAGGVGAAVAVGYGLVRERSLLSALVALAVIAGGHVAEGWLRLA